MWSHIEKGSTGPNLNRNPPYRDLGAEPHDFKSSPSFRESGQEVSCLGQENKGYHQTRPQTRDEFLASSDLVPLAGELAKQEGCTEILGIVPFDFG